MGCKIDPNSAHALYSDRFMNQPLCPVPSRYDSSGRPSCATALTNEVAGCSNPYNRIVYENTVYRPQYAAYIAQPGASTNGPNSLSSTSSISLVGVGNGSGGSSMQMSQVEAFTPRLKYANNSYGIPMNKMIRSGR